jgi:hypothetical protein
MPCDVTGKRALVTDRKPPCVANPRRLRYNSCLKACSGFLELVQDSIRSPLGTNPDSDYSVGTHRQLTRCLPTRPGTHPAHVGAYLGAHPLLPGTHATTTVYG